MTLLKSLLKGPRHRYQILLLLTFLLAMIYFLQISYLYSIVKTKYKKLRGETKPQTDAEIPIKNSTTKRFPQEILIHLDLKGAPPKTSYLLNFFPFIKNLGATGILIEYEDMFPYQDGLEDISALNAYSPSDIAAILQAAEINNLTVIPLIPIFSHFEFVLKLEKYKEFREAKNNPQVLCPNQENVYSILKKMIDQVLKAHGNSKHLHIGCDEAEVLGVCDKCQKLMREKRWRRDIIYFNHVKKIAEYIIETHPGVQPIIWGDKFIKKNEKIISSRGIHNVVEVMLWNYRPEEIFFPPKEDMEFLSKLFKNIWIANAFKGATGSTQIITNIEYHLKNSRGWLDFVAKWKNMINIKGITLTGWQRYNHFAVLCELLPVGIPSLTLNLKLMQLKSRKGIQDEKIMEFLKCSDPVPLDLYDMQNLTRLSKLKCNFPGFKVYHTVHLVYNVLQSLASSLNNLNTEDFSFYSLVHNGSNPANVHAINLKIYERQLLELNDLKSKIRVALEEVYDQHTISEWIITNLMPMEMRLEAAINVINAIQNTTIWPRRPYINDEFRAKNFFNKICTKSETMGCAFLNIH